MRVLYLTDSLSDLDGVGRYAISLVRALEARDTAFQPRFLLSRKHRPTSEGVPAHWPVEVALPPDYFFYMSPARFAASFALALPRVWRAAQGADVVHAIKDYPHNALAARAAHLAGKPCVATAHGTYTVQPLLDERHAPRALRAYRSLDGLISVSGYTARRLGETLGPAALDRSRVLTIPNCVDTDRLAAPGEIGPRPWHGFDFTLGIGETKERKGHHLALAAFARLAPRHQALHHVIVGRLSGDGYERSLHDIVQRAGLGERVHFLGNVSEGEKIDLLHRARALVHTPVTASDGGFEGFGLVYLEASACAIPVIGTLDSGAEDAIVDGHTGFLAAPNAEAVEAALERLLSDEALAARLGAAGREHALANTWAENAARVAALYRDVCRR